ncbi:MAG: hypothetical protein ACJ8FS_10705 [Sphingomicrobium sp.]
MNRAMRRRERFSIAVVLVLAIAAAAMAVLGITGVSPRDLRDLLHSTAADGSWKAITFDGLPVKSKNYLVAIRRGKVFGGYDDCNGWSYTDEKPDKNGERKMLSTLVSCSADNELRRLYHLLVHSPHIDVLGGKELRLSSGGHEGRFQRCKPDRERFRCTEM